MLLGDGQRFPLLSPDPCSLTVSRSSREGQQGHPDQNGRSCLQTTQESYRKTLTYQQHVTLCCFFACLICRSSWSWGNIPLIPALGNWRQEERIRDQHGILIEMQASMGIHLTKPPWVAWQDCLQKETNKKQFKPLTLSHLTNFIYCVLCI